MPSMRGLPNRSLGSLGFRRPPVLGTMPGLPPPGIQGHRRIALPTHTPLQPGLSTPCRPVILHHGSLNMIYGILLDVALTRVVSA